jgi:hypothetical protein
LVVVLAPPRLPSLFAFPLHSLIRTRVLVTTIARASSFEFQHLSRVNHDFFSQQQHRSE